jgi:glutamate-1-semialdehyde 2,1-aminomutase
MPMTSKDNQEPSKTFCILPWMHLALMPEGTARVCCVATQPVEVNGAPASVQTHDLDAIWNSQHMRRIRQRMLDGKHVADCATCYVAEKQGGFSQRVHSNTRWSQQLGDSYLERVHEASKQDNVVAEPPLSYQLIPGNNCNLKCRMCFPVFSSRIENDAVHRAWAPPYLQTSVELLTLRDAIDWTRGKVNLGPHPHAGVDATGLHSLEAIEGRPCRWTDGDAQWTLSLPAGVRPKSVRVRLWGLQPKGHRLRVSINGQQLFDGKLASKNWETTVPVPAGKLTSLTVRLHSDTFRAPSDPRELGVAVQDLELIHDGTAQHQADASQPKHLPNGPWYRDDRWIREVLLQNVDQLEGLYFTGGEPMIEKQVEKILDHIIQKQAAGRVVLEINTNCTIIRDDMLAKLKQFKRVTIALSLDAYGTYHEYIRFPARWEPIRQNIEKCVAASSDSFDVVATPVIQVYNLLNLVEVFEYFDAIKIRYGVRFASMPWFLNIDVLPASVRLKAVARLEAYAKLCPENQREVVLSTAQQIAATKDKCTKEGLQTFMLFTNDLDAGRGQSFRKVHAELLQLLEAEGFKWTDQRSHAAA